jgi:hypothetical protein
MVIIYETPWGEGDGIQYTNFNRCSKPTSARQAYRVVVSISARNKVVL